MLYKILWTLNDDEADPKTQYESLNLFTKSRAEELLKVANKHFKRATHWMEPAEAPTSKNA